MDLGGVCDYFDESASQFDLRRKYWKKYGTRAAPSGNTWGNPLPRIPQTDRESEPEHRGLAQKIFQQREQLACPGAPSSPASCV